MDSDILENYIVNKLTHDIKQDFCKLPDEMKNQEFAKLFDSKEELVQRIKKTKKLIKDVYNSLENVEKPILFYEAILKTLDGENND